MNNGTGKKSLYGKLLSMTLLPLFLLALIITFFSARRFIDTINK